MKKYISVILICCLILQWFGCYSPQLVSQNSESDLINLVHKSLVCTLVSGEVISSKAYHHIMISSPNELIVGTGDKFIENYKLPFEGKILLRETDTSYYDKAEENFIVYLKSGDRIELNKGDYFIATVETENGLWFWKEDFTRKVDIGEIQAIEETEFNTSIIFIAIGIIVIVLLIVFVEEEDSSWDLSGMFGMFNVKSY